MSLWLPKTIKLLTHEYYYNNEYCHGSKPHLHISLKGLGLMQSHPPTVQDVRTPTHCAGCTYKFGCLPEIASWPRPDRVCSILLPCANSTMNGTISGMMNRNATPPGQRTSFFESQWDVSHSSYQSSNPIGQYIICTYVPLP